MAEAPEIEDKWTEGVIFICESDGDATDEIDGMFSDGNVRQVNVENTTTDDVTVEPDESFLVKEKGPLVQPSLKVHIGQKHNENCDPRCSTDAMDARLRTHSLEKPSSFDSSDFGSVHALLKVPMKTYTAEPYKCNACDYRCSFAMTLKNHLKTHSEKRHSCNMCDYRCSTATALKVHMRTHTGEKPYTCDKCAYRSWHAQNLRNHMGIHTGEMAYSCTFCDYKCETAATLNSHSKFHTGEKAYYACDDCNFRCGAAVKMRSHIWKNH